VPFLLRRHFASRKTKAFFKFETHDQHDGNTGDAAVSTQHSFLFQISQTLDFSAFKTLNIRMNSIVNLSVKQLRQVVNLKEKIEALENELSQLFGSTAKPVAAETPKKRRKMSAAARRKIGAAQKARWAKVNANKTAKPAKKKFTMSAAAKAKISAAAKARWAKYRAEKK
jgi:hypothetical protein